MRCGLGYDVHRLVVDRQLILGGVAIPYEMGLLGHSDADVLVHAIMDALLGAVAGGDIGQHFPDNKQDFKNISSMILLARVQQFLSEKGWNIGNIDATVVAQRPKLAPYITSMRGKIAVALGIEVSQVSVKATTTEGLGFAGQGEGIAAYAIAMVI